MKKIKFLGLGSLMLVGTLFSTHKSEARIAAQIGIIYPNGCIGTQTTHTALFGLVTWITNEWVDCPPGVSPPAGATEWTEGDQP